MALLHITKDTFDAEVLQSQQPVLIDFWADWCGPCRMLAPMIEELAGELTDVKVGKVNVDEEPELAMEYQVMSIPTVLVMKGGQEVNRMVGVRPKQAILDLLK